MLLLLDIGNTHTHLGLAENGTIRKQGMAKTSDRLDGTIEEEIEAFCGRKRIEAGSFCSVVPRATTACAESLSRWGLPFLELNARTVKGVGIDYPKPGTIGPDRLANALAVKALHGAPAVVVDFGTAVTFDVVNGMGNYIGGIIAPGLSAMTDYLHEKTALLPRIKIREVSAAIGKNTEQAMLIGAVHGYRGLIRGLLQNLKAELKVRRLPVVATGGCAELVAGKMPEITAIQPNLTLEGLRLNWELSR